MSSSKCSMWGGSLVAHEIEHGVYKFQHTFDYGVAEKSTDNLMDNNNVDFLGSLPVEGYAGFCHVCLERIAG